MVYLDRLKAPRKAVGQMDLLTAPYVNSVDSKVIQVEEALSASSPLARPLRPFSILTTAQTKPQDRLVTR